MRKDMYWNILYMCDIKIFQEHKCSSIPEKKKGIFTPCDSVDFKIKFISFSQSNFEWSKGILSKINEKLSK